MESAPSPRRPRTCLSGANVGEGRPISRRPRQLLSRGVRLPHLTIGQTDIAREGLQHGFRTLAAS